MKQSWKPILLTIVLTSMMILYFTRGHAQVRDTVNHSFPLTGVVFDLDTTPTLTYFISDSNGNLLLHWRQGDKMEIKDTIVLIKRLLQLWNECQLQDHTSTNPTKNIDFFILPKNEYKISK